MRIAAIQENCFDTFLELFIGWQAKRCTHLTDDFNSPERSPDPQNLVHSFAHRSRADASVIPAMPRGSFTL